MNNLAIILKKKRDEEARLARTSPQTVFNDDGTDQSWAIVVGGGSMSKDEIEDVLTGEISSHNHSGLYYTKDEIDARQYEPVTNGDADAPEILFFNGDVVMAEANI